MHIHLIILEICFQVKVNFFYVTLELLKAKTLPATVLGQRDVLGAAETGSGKTLAFGIPILHRILEYKEQTTGR
jgi:superfamily II DNA/RNA helicase